MSGIERKTRVTMSDEELRQSLHSAVSENAIGYYGHAVFLPSLDSIAQAIGITRQTIHQRGGFTQWLEYATGLTVIHRGIVLGDPEDLTIPQLEP